MSDRFKQIMYEFVTYPSDHNLRLTDESWELARTMIRANWKSLLNLSDRNIRFLIVRHAIEFRKRSLENFTSEIDQIKNKAPTKLFERKYLLGEEKSKKDERLLQTIPY
ncbi:MAG: hypothetical protein LRY73_02645 [Bacillus sp. (in: Bacteria)]|nr:hypothetical protein [Bacillus sp. (in: firmicutes)]